MANPLNKTDLSNAKKALVILRDLEADIEVAVEAGLDMSEEDARRVHLQKSLQAILDKYDNPSASK